MGKTILIQAIQNSLCILAIYTSLQEGMIFGIIGRFLAKYLTISFVAKPIYNCFICMGSFWSCVFWIIQGFDLTIYLPITILATVGINTLLSEKAEELLFFYHKNRLAK